MARLWLYLVLQDETEHEDIVEDVSLMDIDSADSGIPWQQLRNELCVSW